MSVQKTSLGVTLLISVLEKIDEYLKTGEAKGSGFTSRPDVIYEALRIFFKNKNSPNQQIESTKFRISLIDAYKNKILLNDSEKGTILVMIDDKNKLQCYDCKDDPHDNKYVRFCLKNKNLWNFLKKNKVKLVKPRTLDKDLLANQ